VLPPSSRGLGRRPLTAETGVRIPVAVLLACVASSAGCGSEAKPTLQDTAVRRHAEAQIQRRVMADMRANANPVDGPPVRVQASCLTQTGSGRNYQIDCRATRYERPRVGREVSGGPISMKVASAHP